MASDEFIYRLLCKSVTILKLMKCSKFLDIESVWQNDIYQSKTQQLQSFMTKWLRRKQYKKYGKIFYSTVKSAVAWKSHLNSVNLQHTVSQQSTVITWFAFQKMFRLITGDLRHRCEDMSTVGGGTLNAVAVINTAVPGFFVDIKLQEQSQERNLYTADKVKMECKC